MQPEATPLPATTLGYVAARLDDTTLLIDLLAIQDIRNAADPEQGCDLAPVQLSGSMRSLAGGPRKQILVIADKTGKFSLCCDDARVLPAAKLKVQPLRRCMNGQSSLFTGMARIGETLAFLCHADELGALTRRLWEQEHGKRKSHPD